MNNGLLIALGLGAVAAAVVVAASKKNENQVRINPGKFRDIRDITVTSPGYNPLRYTGTFDFIDTPYSAQPKQGT